MPSTCGTAYLPSRDGCAGDVCRGLTVVGDRKDKGIKFSYPFATGQPIGTVVKGEQGKVSGVFWLKPFSADLWFVLIAALVVFVPIIVALLLGAQSRQAAFRPCEQQEPHGVLLWMRMYLYGLFNGFSILIHGETPGR
jgi:hypothetical protein